MRAQTTSLLCSAPGNNGTNRAIELRPEMDPCGTEQANGRGPPYLRPQAVNYVFALTLTVNCRPGCVGDCACSGRTIHA